MNSPTNSTKKSFYLNIKPIRSKFTLRNAFKHNSREIQAELGANSHIDATKIHLNQSLVQKRSLQELMQRVTDVIDCYEEKQSRRIRHDAVIAIEVLFSLPASAKEFSPIDYFKDCLDWTAGQFLPAEVLTADVHLDEAAPHLHVILLAVSPTGLHGSKIKGNKFVYRERQQHFYDNVAGKYGLQTPPTRLPKAVKVQLAKQVISKIETLSDPLTRSPHFSLIRNSIEEDPAPWAHNLGIEVKEIPKKMRTLVQIMTSKGKGAEWQSEA